MSITYRPPFDEDDERDLRALYRRHGPGANPELDAAVRRRWHPGHSWHPAWGAAACAAMVFGLFAWTEMREAQDFAEQNTPVIAPHEIGTSSERAPALLSTPAQAPAEQAAPVTERVAAPPQEAAPQAAPAQEAAPVQEAAPAEQPAAEPAAPETPALSDQDIEARVTHIRALVREEQQEEAVQALRELQQAAPDLTLPDDLQELAQQNPA
ncbi:MULTISPECIES: hypothetical protein [Achromobacter]|uniref:hypothetical protein n=1 Tax=Achromobacter TaxID=222 RepID=UPI0007510D5A|nr:MULTISPECIES: hypothetical protein [Achromobacter]MDH1300162.1 hypothetical protein [Achromobacter sp. GD03932]WLW64165.1 hypothetical protein RA224_12280 [Achromobacter aegrifaciens]